MALQFLTALAAWLDRRVQPDETGASVVEWMVLGVLAIVVVVGLIPGMRDLAGRVLTYIGDQLGV